MSRYLLFLHLRTMLGLFCGLVAVLFLFRFADVAQRMNGPETAGFATLLWQAILRTPMELQGVMPHVAMVSAALALHRASSRFEIAVMVQTGLSGWRILAPLMVGGAIMGLVYLAVLSPIVAAAHQVAEVRGGMGARQVVVDDGTLRTLVFADRVAPDGRSLDGLSVIQLDAQNRLDIRYTAASAQWTGSEWALAQVQVMRQAREGAIPTLALRPDLLAHHRVGHMATPITALPQAIAHAAATGMPAQGYRLQLQVLLALPVLLGVLSALAGAVALHPLPRGQWRGAALAVVAVAFVYYTMSTVANAMALRAVISPAAAAWGLPALGLPALVVWRLMWRW